MISEDILKKAVNSILLVDFSLAKTDYKKNLPKDVQKDLTELAKKQGVTGATSDLESKISLWGSYHGEFNDLILKPFGQFRNGIIYKLLEIGNGSRAIPVAEFPKKYPEIEARRDALLRTVQQVADERLYVWQKEGQADALRTLGKVFPDADKWVRDNQPTKQEFIEQFYVTVSEPRKINLDDLSGVALPAEMIKRFQKEAFEKVQRTLEDARETAIGKLRASLSHVEKHLRSGKRFHESMIENLRDSADTCEGLIKAYDSDARVLAVIDQIKTQISHLTSEQYKESIVARDNGARAARTADKQLKDLEKRDIQKITADAENIALGDDALLGDLL